MPYCRQNKVKTAELHIGLFQSCTKFKFILQCTSFQSNPKSCFSPNTITVYTSMLYPYGNAFATNHFFFSRKIPALLSEPHLTVTASVKFSWTLHQSCCYLLYVPILLEKYHYFSPEHTMIVITSSHVVSLTLVSRDYTYVTSDVSGTLQTGGWKLA